MALCTRSVSARAVARPAVRVASVKPVSRVITRSTPVSGTDGGPWVSDGASRFSLHACFIDALAAHGAFLQHGKWIGIAVGPMQPLLAQTDWRGHRDPVCVPLCMQDKAAVETAIKEAEEKCASGTSGECAAAWDNVSAEQ